jgi:hypothetical protein
MVKNDLIFQKPGDDKRQLFEEEKILVPPQPSQPYNYNYNNKLIEEEEKQPMVYQQPKFDEPKKMFEYESSAHKPKYDPTAVAMGYNMGEQ